MSLRKIPGPLEHPACRFQESAAPFAQGQMPAAEREAFAAHLDGCAVCRREVEDFRAVLARLKDLPAEPPGRDLAGPLVADIFPERRRLVFWSWRARPVRWAAACLTGFILGGFTLLLTESKKPAGPGRLALSGTDLTRARSEGLAWLAAAQEPDGSWAPGRWGGQERHAVALTGAALLAFLEDDAAARTYAGAVGKAAQALLRAQGGAGRFGPPGEQALYNHGIATAALLSLYAHSGNPALRSPLGRAVTHICAAERADGGWGYDPGGADPANAALTVWQVHALARATDAGWEEARAPLERGLAWMRGLVDGQGRLGYRASGDFPCGHETLTAMGAFGLAGPSLTAAERARWGDSLRAISVSQGREVDYYRWFFLTRALPAVEENAGASRPWVAELQKMLVDAQVREGPLAGSWEPADRWSAAGGRVFATAFAALALSAR